MELHVLHRHGWSIAALAREFGLNWRTARRYASADGAADGTGRGRDRRSSRRPGSPTSSGAWRPVPTCGRRCSTASSREGYGYTGSYTSLRRRVVELRPTDDRRARDPLRDRTRDPDPGRLDRLRDLAARRRARADAVRLRRHPRLLADARPSGSPPTRRGPRPCAAIVRCVDDLGGATAEFLTDRDTALMSGSRADGSPIYAPEWVDTAALLGTRPRACRPYRAKTKGKVERVIREVKEDFLAWLTGQVLPGAPDPRLVRRAGEALGDRGRRASAATGRPGGSSARHGPRSGRC